MSEPIRTFGGGAPVTLEWLTNGKVRMTLDHLHPFLRFALVTADPDTSVDGPGFFFRTSGGKQQFCVRFSSGVVQVVATEP